MLLIAKVKKLSEVKQIYKTILTFFVYIININLKKQSAFGKKFVILSLKL